jgi:hypothetical protein
MFNSLSNNVWSIENKNTALSYIEKYITESANLILSQ